MNQRQRSYMAGLLAGIGLAVMVAGWPWVVVGLALVFIGHLEWFKRRDA